MANHITRNTRVNVSHKTREVSVADIQPFMPDFFLSSRSPGVPSNPYGVTGMLNVDRNDMRVNYRHKKLDQPSIQQI